MISTALIEKSVHTEAAVTRHPLSARLTNNNKINL